MSAASGPEISNNGLVFLYDMANTQKSWKGAPATNLWIYSRALTNWNKTSAITVTDNSALSPYGDLTASTITANGTGGSYINLGGTLISSGSTYTKSVYAKAGSTSTLVFESYDNNGSGGTAFFPTTFDLLNGTYTASSGDTATMTYIANGWYRCRVTRSYTLTTASGTFYIGAYGTGLGTLYLWDAQLELGSFATPVVSTNGASVSRSNTQALLDATGNNTLTATSLTYASNGTFSFDGSFSYLQSASNCGITGDVTLSAWIKPNRTGQTGPHSTVICTDVNYPYGAKLMNYKNSSRYGIWLGWAGGGNTNYEAFVGVNINDNTDKMLTASWTQSTGIAKIYLNGVLQSTQNTGITSAVALADGKITIGTDYNSIGSGSLNKYLGNIYQASIYNRTLTDAEVQQNFNATRSRYGI